MLVEARRDSAPADHAPDSMPKDAPAKITATSRPEAPATADPAVAKPVPEAEEGVTNAGHISKSASRSIALQHEQPE